MSETVSRTTWSDRRSSTRRVTCSTRSSFGAAVAGHAAAADEAGSCSSDARIAAKASASIGSAATLGRCGASDAAGCGGANGIISGSLCGTTGGVSTPLSNAGSDDSARSAAASVIAVSDGGGGNSHGSVAGAVDSGVPNQSRSGAASLGAVTGSEAAGAIGLSDIVWNAASRRSK